MSRSAKYMMINIWIYKFHTEQIHIIEYKFISAAHMEWSAEINL